MNEDRVMKISLVVGIVLAGLLFFAAPAVKSAEIYKPVDTALVLAVDVSGSVNDERWDLQRNGIADVLESPDFGHTIRMGAIGRVAITIVQWGTMAHSMPWRILENHQDAVVYAQEIRSMTRQESGGTCMGTALKKIDQQVIGQWLDYAGRVIVDVSGDGATNCGMEFITARQALLDQGITINGLPIITPIEPKIDQWYEENVIGGPGAFMVVADGYKEFAQAFKKKFIIEIAMR